MLLAVSFNEFLIWDIVLIAAANVVFFLLYKLVWKKKKEKAGQDDLRARDVSPKKDTSDAIRELAALDERVYVDNKVINATGESDAGEKGTEKEQKPTATQQVDLSQLPDDVYDSENCMTDNATDWFDSEKPTADPENLSDYNYANEGMNNPTKRKFARAEQMKVDYIEALHKEEEKAKSRSYAAVTDEPDEPSVIIPKQKLDNISFDD